MSKKIVLVTGASTGLGRDTAETLARAGHSVFASMRGTEGKNRAHTTALRRLASKETLTIIPLDLDVTSEASVERAVETLLRTAGRIDVVVNNAGIASAGVSEAFTAEQVRELFEVNVVGLHRVTRTVLPALRQQGEGLVINVGSILGRVTFPFFGIYGASKFAVEALTDSYRCELSQLGIEVVLVQPSAYPTPMYANLQHAADPTRAAEYGEISKIPGKMLSTFTELFESSSAPNPHDVAEAIERLISQPNGSRATRTVVGSPFGADAVNANAASVQAKVIEGLGLGHLTNGRTASS
jgi:NAD(P)-dependent dehydrogenase (short-subunit alcohol dehydrogenase family)